jgi:hypothetical protein
MTNIRLNNEKIEEFWLLKAPPKRRVYKIYKSPIYKQIMLPGHVKVRSSTFNRFRISTAQSNKRWARATWYLGCTWCMLDRILLGSSADALERVMLRLDRKCAWSQLLCD